MHPIAKPGSHCQALLTLPSRALHRQATPPIAKPCHPLRAHAIQCQAKPLCAKPCLTLTSHASHGQAMLPIAKPCVSLPSHAFHCQLVGLSSARPILMAPFEANALVVGSSSVKAFSVHAKYARLVPIGLGFVDDCSEKRPFLESTIARSAY